MLSTTFWNFVSVVFDPNVLVAAALGAVALLSGGAASVAEYLDRT